MPQRPVLPILLAAVLCSSCSRSKPVVIGSKDSPEQQLLAEIIAQHLEHQNIKVARRPPGGDTRTVHQALVDGGIGLYVEYSGLIVSEILREEPSPDLAVTFERARQEMQRLEQVEFLAPFGFNSPVTLVVRAQGQEDMTLGTQAASSPNRWRIGVTYEFQNQPSGLPSLNKYRFELGAPVRAMEEKDLFSAMDDPEKPVDMVLASRSDAHLTLPAWKALEDNLSAFPPAQAGVLVRNDVLAAEPNLRSALLQLQGKINLDTMRKLNARVVLDGRPVSEIAADFLKSAGL